MEDSNAVVSSFAIVRANVSSTSLPFATRYQTSVANSSRCSSSRKHHDALFGDGVNDTDVNEVAMVVPPSFARGALKLIDCGKSCSTAFGTAGRLGSTAVCTRF